VGGAVGAIILVFIGCLFAIRWKAARKSSPVHRPEDQASAESEMGRNMETGSQQQADIASTPSTEVELVLVANRNAAAHASAQKVWPNVKDQTRSVDTGPMAAEVARIGSPQQLYQHPKTLAVRSIDCKTQARSVTDAPLVEGVALGAGSQELGQHTKRPRQRLDIPVAELVMDASIMSEDSGDSGLTDPEVREPDAEEDNGCNQM
jgi:hypothetical protein